MAGGELVCVDSWKVADIESRFDQNVGSRVTKVKGHITSVLVGMAAAGERFDVIYIDGDHEARIVLEDSVLAWRLLRVGAVIVWDDYRWTTTNANVIPPQPAIDAFLSMYAKAEVVHREWQVIAVKRGE